MCIFHNHVQSWSHEVRTQNYEHEHAKLKNAVLGGTKMAHFWYIWKATFSNFVIVIRPRINVTCMDKIAVFVCSGSCYHDRVSFVRDYMYYTLLVRIVVFPLFLCHVLYASIYKQKHT